MKHFISKDIWQISIALSLIISCSSCIQFIGLTDDFSKLSMEQQSLIHEFDSSTQLIENNIYLINGKALRKELAKHEKSMVYLFTNGCKSKYCTPLKSYIENANKNGYKLFLVMTGFGNLAYTLRQSAPTHYFAIDSKYYEKKFRTIYSRMFENDFLNRELDFKEKEYQGNIFYFEGDTLVEIKQSLK
jgi:hypothetical protein